MEIVNSTPDDLPMIIDLFRSAIEYQKKNGFELWPDFKEAMIKREIREKRHWKIMDEKKVLCIFSVMYSDPVIWGEERDKDPAVYLHRITVNPEHKGKKLMILIRDWAIQHAGALKKKFVRLDTWGKNENLRNYYVQCGFPYIGQQHLKFTEGLPGHYGGNELSLFEIEIDKS